MTTDRPRRKREVGKEPIVVHLVKLDLGRLEKSYEAEKRGRKNVVVPSHRTY